MSIKENVDAIKSELNTEEKFFEKIVRLEFIYKKYRYAIFAAVIAVIAYFVTMWVYDMQQASRIAAANQAFETLVEKGETAEQLALLKEKSKKLFDLYRFQKAVKDSDIAVLEELTKSKAFGIADMAKYQHAVLSGDEKALADYIDKKGFYFRDMALLQKASALLKQSKIKEAHELLARIDSRSPLFEQAELLAHYGIASK